LPLKRKRSMTSFDVASVVQEIGGLAGSRVSNIYGLPGGGFLFKLQGGRRIIAVPGERVHITSYDIGEKGFPPPLVMGLRKHLRGARLRKVEQLGFDRIVVMHFENNGSMFRLVVEVLPRGVLALLSHEGAVLQASEFREMRDRVIRRGAVYEPPPGRLKSPLELGEDELRGLVEGSEGEAVRVLVRNLGYPGEVVEEALLRIGLDPLASVKEVAGSAAQLLDQLRRIYEEALTGRGSVLYSGEAPLTVVTFEPRGLVERYGYTVRRFPSASEAFDAYFVAGLKQIEEYEHASRVSAEKERLLHSIERAKKNLEELKEKLARIDRYIELVGENIGALYEAYECARRVKERSGWEYIAGNCPGVVDVQPREGKIAVSIGGVIVPMSIRLPPDRLLVELSRKRGELEAKISRGRKALEELEAKLRGLEESARRLTLRGRALVRKKEWYEKYHWLVTSNGFLAIGGRDASQNESVVKRYLNDKRIFMHADVHGAPIVVVFAEGATPPERDMREAALLTAAYSKAWKMGLSSVDVYWVWGSQVSKSPPAGEYLAKGAFMVYGRRNYIRGVELRIAIGAGIEEEYPVVIVGPEDLVRRRSASYAVLVPGDEDPSRLAKRLRRLLASKAGTEHKPIIESLRVEDILPRIPGKSRVIHVGRGDAAEPPRPLKHLHGEKAG